MMRLLERWILSRGGTRINNVLPVTYAMHGAWQLLSDSIPYSNSAMHLHLDTCHWQTQWLAITVCQSRSLGFQIDFTSTICCWSLAISQHGMF